MQVDVALSNAMGLGGHNACVLLGRVAVMNAYVAEPITRRRKLCLPVTALLGAVIVIVFRPIARR